MKLKRLKNKAENYFNYLRDLVKASKSESIKSGLPRPYIFMDILWQRIAYSQIILDYQVQGFSYIRSRKERDKFLMSKDWQRINYSVNNMDAAKYDYETKIGGYKALKKYFKRDVIIIDEASRDEIEEFLKKHKTSYAKVDFSYGGLGIEKLYSKDFENAIEFYAYCKKRKYAIVEEEIKQHPHVTKLSPTSINTVRIITLMDPEGKIHLMQHIMRMSNGTNNIDNITSGGIYVWLDSNGVITSKYATGDNMDYDPSGDIMYEKHPVSGIYFKGYKIPFIKEAEEMVIEAAKLDENYKYLGWDIAITEKGPDIVEVNTGPGYDMIQNYHHRLTDNPGTREQFEKIFDIKFNVKNNFLRRGKHLIKTKEEYTKTYKANRRRY